MADRTAITFTTARQGAPRFCLRTIRRSMLMRWGGDILKSSPRGMAWTLPKTADPDGNGRPRRPVPLLIYVHGGPWAAIPWNDWITNRSLQLLADRGFAALRVEFRGANGFGRKVEEASV